MTQYMTIAAIAFLVVEVLIVGIGILIGYRRGLGRTVVRAVYLAIIGVVSFFAGRTIANKITATVLNAVMPLIPEDISALLAQKPELSILLEHLLGALLVPFIFAILFAILQLLTLICFKLLSTKLVTAITKKTERTTVTKWTGAAAGMVLGIVVAAVLLSPMYTLLHVVESIPDDTIAIVEEAISENGMSLEADTGFSTTAMHARPNTIALAASSHFKASSISPLNEALIAKLTVYTIPATLDGEPSTESATDTLPILLTTAGDALYAYNVTAKNGGSQIDAITNAAAAVATHLSESCAVRHVAADALYLVGVSFRDNGSFMDIELPQSDNAILTSIVNNLVDTLAHTTPATVEANMNSLFGSSEIKYGTESAASTNTAINKGLLSSMTKLDKDDPMKSLQDEALSDAVASAIGNLADNENMSGVLTDIKDFAVGIIQDSDIDLSDEKYDALYEDISTNLSDKFTEHVSEDDEQTASVSDVAKSLESTIESYFDQYNIPTDSFQTSVIATCIAQEFYKEENIVDGSISVTVDDVLEFFGIAQSDIDNFLNGGSGSGTGSEGGSEGTAPVIPDDCDINDLPEDFDINDLPEDFDINDLPEGIDPSVIPGQ